MGEKDAKESSKAKPEAGGNSETQQVPKKKWKRKKSRSRKNRMRRDNRPAHLRPTYLTPGAEDYVGDRPTCTKPKSDLKRKRDIENKDERKVSNSNCNEMNEKGSDSEKKDSSSPINAKIKKAKSRVEDYVKKTQKRNV